MLVAIEGADGCGKSTVAMRLAEDLDAQLIEFPERNLATTGPALDYYLKKSWWVDGNAKLSARDLDKLGALAFQALNVVNRLEYINVLKTCAGNPLQHFVVGRYWQSGVVYGGLDGLDPEWLERIMRVLPPADHNILLQVDVQEAMQRRARRDGALPVERYEGSHKRTLEVSQRFRDLWEAHVNDPAWICIDGNQKAPEVMRDIHKRIMV